jgi:DNA-binding transcriptional ArsR family regulator
MGVLRLSLGQSQASKVAKLLANDTASKIMDALSIDSKSESELAKELDMPLSTVHYNVQKLNDTGILTSDEFTYSEKGKEIRHYRLASEHIIISTKPSSPLPEITAGGVLALAVAAGIALVNQPTVIEESSVMARTLVADSAAESMAVVAPVASQPVVWPWILLGAGIVLAVIASMHLYRRYQ